MATFTFFDEFGNNLGNGAIDLDSHTFKVALTNTAPTKGTDDEFADIVEIGAGNGYSAGGQALDSVQYVETGAGTGIWRFISADELFTASGGSIGPFRYAAVYDDTSTNDKLVGYLDYGTNLTITSGNSFLIDVGTSGFFELAMSP